MIRQFISIRFVIVAVALQTALAIGILVASQGELFQTLGSRTYDSWIRSLNTETGISVVVDVDERSIAALGQWPWPRTTQARLLMAINKDKPAVVAFDILFAEPDRSSPSHYDSWLKAEFGQEAGLNNVPEESWDNDAIFAQALQTAPTILGCLFYNSTPTLSHTVSESKYSSKGLDIKWSGEKLEILRFIFPDRNSSLLPLPAFLPVTDIGDCGIFPDPGGVVRSIPLITRHGETYYPTLALAAYLKTLDDAPSLSGILRNGADAELTISGITTPLNESGSMMIRFPNQMPARISAIDVLTGQTPAGTFSNKAVFVGATAFGLDNTFSTPAQRRTPGLDIHAAAFDTLWLNQYIQRPAWSLGAHALLLTITALALSCIPFLTLPFHRLAASLTLGALFWLAAKWLFAVHGIFLSPYPELAQIGAAAILTAGLSPYPRQRRS